MKKNITYWVGILLVSLAMSPLFTYIILKIIPYNFSELILIPGLLIINISNRTIRNIFSFNLRSYRFLILLFILGYFFLIGSVTGGNIGNVYADFRSILFFIFFSILVLRNRRELIVMEKFIFSFFIGVSFFDSIFLLTARSFFDITDPRYILMTIAPFVVSLTYLRKGKFIFSFIFLGVLIYQAVLSAMRLNYIFLLCYAVYLVILFLKSIMKSTSVLKWNRLKLIIFTFIIFFSSYFISSSINSFLKSNGSRYLHSVLRTEKLFENPEEEEITRINSTLLVFYEPLELFIPQGIGTRNQSKRVQSLFRNKYNVLSSADSSIFYWIYDFGLVLGLIAIFYIFKTISKGLIKIWKTNTFSNFSYFLMLAICFLSLFLTKSWIFMYLNFGFTYSLLILLIRYPSLVRIPNQQ